MGRAAECAAIARAVDTAVAGHGGGLALVGEAGIGKSRLCEYAREYAQRQGLLVLSGRAVDGPSATAFRPLSEALSSGFRETGAPRDPAVTALLPTLAHLVPHWSTRVAPHASVLAIAEAVLRLLEVAGRDHGVLLMVEDLHWADQDTLAVLEYLLDNTAAHGALCLLTCRPEPPVVHVARRAADRRVATLLDLGPLPDADVDGLTLSCLGQEAVSAELLEFLRRHADGVPFFVEELLAGLVRAGVLARGEDGWKVTGPLAAAVPASFAESAAGRVGALSPDERRVLGAAAMLGREIDWRPLPAVTGLPESAVLDALRTAAEALLLSTDEGVVRFRHALTREYVLAQLLPPERAALAARALAAVPDTDPELVADLARQAGDLRRAVAGLVTSAEQARDRGALATAAVRLDEAAQLQTGAEDGLLITERLAEVRALAGDVEAATALAEPALAARRANQQPRHIVDLELVLSRAALTAGAYERAQEHADRAGEVAAQAEDAPRRARASVVAAQIAVARGAVAEAERLAAEALESTDEAELPDVWCEAMEVRGRCRRLHDVHGAERIFDAALAVAERYGLSLWRARALHELGTIDLLDRMSTDRLVAARRAAIEAGAPALAAVVDFHLASALVARNSLADGRVAAQRAVDVAQRLRLSILVPALTVLARSHAHERDHATVGALVERITAVAGDDPEAAAGIESHVYAMLALHEADREAARAALDRAADLWRRRPGGHDPHRGLWALLCTLDGDGAAERAEAARAPGSDTRFNRAGLRAAEAVAAGRDGDRAAAEARFAACLEEVRGYLGGEWLVHLIEWLVAPAAHADGWGDPASALRVAVRWFADHGYEPLAASCRRLLREVGAPVPRAGRGVSPVPDPLATLGVTSREVDVLRLLVAGMTNRQIAQRLVLSPKTVEKHVASLLSKTGRPDREQLREAYASLLTRD